MLRRRVLAMLSGSVATLSYLGQSAFAQNPSPINLSQEQVSRLTETVVCDVPNGHLTTAPPGTGFEASVRGGHERSTGHFILSLPVGDGDRPGMPATHTLTLRYHVVDNFRGIELAAAEIALLSSSVTSGSPETLRISRVELENGIRIGSRTGLDPRPIDLEAWRNFAERGARVVIWHRDFDRRIAAPLIVQSGADDMVMLRLRNLAPMRDILAEAFDQMRAIEARRTRLHATNRNWARGTQLGEGCAVPDRDCFLTTACVQAAGLPDDCFELKSLRLFRDRVLALTPEGRAMIAAYYQHAPALVARIDAKPDARRIWLATYLRFILPCALLARAGLKQAALARYRRMIDHLDDIA